MWMGSDLACGAGGVGFGFQQVNEIGLPVEEEVEKKHDSSCSGYPAIIQTKSFVCSDKNLVIVSMHSFE